MRMYERAKARDKLLVGVRLGGRCDADGVLAEIENFCSSPLVGACYILAKADATPEHYLKWAKALKEKKTFFLLNVRSGKPMEQETVAEIRKIAGEFYLGAHVATLNECGSKTAIAPYSVFEGEFEEEGRIDDLKESFDSYIRMITDKISESRSCFGGVTTAHEATAHVKYLYASGIDIVISEVMNGNLEIQTAYSRGAARGYMREHWGTLLAHEWYGGLDNDDPMKLKRLKLAYDYMYMAGSNYIFIESGEQSIKSYGSFYPEEHEICRTYRKTREDFTEAVRTDVRPGKGPLCSVGILHGNLDPYTGFGTSSLMYHRGDEDWMIKDSERSWELLQSVKQSIPWYSAVDFGEYSLSNAPAYGAYDIVPVESDVSVLKKYEYLMFLGWNTMTEELYNKLCEYVKCGGRLLISAAHLNTNTKRDGKYLPLRDGRLSELLGCDIVGSVRRDSGVKFLNNTCLPDVHYPAAKTYESANKHVDTIFVSGSVELAKVELSGGTAVAISNSAYRFLDDDPPMLIENKYGDGVVSFVTTISYPAAPEVRSFYSYIMKSLFTASHRGCEVKVVAGDKIEFTVYDEGGGKKKIYLLNTDCLLSGDVAIITGGGRTELRLAPLEMRSVTVLTAGGK